MEVTDTGPIAGGGLGGEVLGTGEVGLVPWGGGAVLSFIRSLGADRGSPPQAGPRVEPELPPCRSGPRRLETSATIRASLETSRGLVFRGVTDDPSRAADALVRIHLLASSESPSL